MRADKYWIQSALQDGLAPLSMPVFWFFQIGPLLREIWPFLWIKVKNQFLHFFICQWTMMCGQTIFCAGRLLSKVACLRAGDNFGEFGTLLRGPPRITVNCFKDTCYVRGKKTAKSASLARAPAARCNTGLFDKTCSNPVNWPCHIWMYILLV